MSNRRRIRKTYKQKQKEVAEVPEIEVIEEQLWSLSEWMETNWRPVVAALGIVTVLWGGAGLYQILSERSARSTAAANAPVYAAAARRVYTPPEGLTGEDPNKPLSPTFASEKERAEAVVAAGSGLEGAAKPFAEVVVGAAKAELGQADAQLAAIDAALATAGDSPIALGLQAQRASALMALGKADEAAATWAKIAETAPTAALKALAQVRIGDLANPRLGAKAGDAGKAKAAYTAAVAALAEGGKAPSEGNAAFLHAEAKLKLAQL